MGKIVRITDYQYKKSYKAEIDVVHDCPIYHFMRWVEKYGLGHTLVEADGPGGGNPCFEIYHMDKNVLRAALSEHHQTQAGDPFIDQEIYQ